ncbi:hypothetical protein ACLBV5_13190 [Brevundimonas sp. M1A4_2e]
MPETMSPREKVAQIIRDKVSGPHFTDPSHFVAMEQDRFAAADAILAALASSGDHAELIEDATEALQIIDAFPSNQGEVEGRITEKGDRLLASCTRDARLALEALIAEVAALRETNTEAERKLAEADQGAEFIARLLPCRRTGGRARQQGNRLLHQHGRVAPSPHLPQQGGRTWVRSQ